MRTERAVDWLARYPRPGRRRVLAGVCALIGERTGIDPTWVRLAFLALALAKGIGLMLYLVLWIVLPSEGESFGRDSFGHTARARARGASHELKGAARGVASAWHRLDATSSPTPLSRRWIALGLVAAGAMVLLGTFGVFDWITPLRALGLVLVAAGAGLVIQTRGGHR